MDRPIQIQRHQMHHHIHRNRNRSSTLVTTRRTNKKLHTTTRNQRPTKSTPQTTRQQHPTIHRWRHPTQQTPSHQKHHHNLGHPGKHPPPNRNNIPNQIQPTSKHHHRPTILHQRHTRRNTHPTKHHPTNQHTTNRLGHSLGRRLPHQQGLHPTTHRRVSLQKHKRNPQTRTKTRQQHRMVLQITSPNQKTQNMLRNKA